MSKKETVNGEVEKNKKIKTKQDKKNLSSLTKRTLSSIVLLVVLFIYCSSGAFYTYNVGKNWADTFSYICILISLIIVSFSIVELCNSFKIHKWYIKTLIIFFAIIVVLWPITDLSWIMYNFSFYMKLETKTWIKNYLFLLVLIASLFFSFLLTFVEKNFKLNESFLFLFFLIVIVLAYKGFTILSLDVFDGIGGSYYSFNTNVWIWLMVILCDTFAFFGGTKFGKNKLAPSISPNKSWEGAIIGYACSFIFGITYSLLFYFLSGAFHPNVPLRGLIIGFGPSDTWKVVLIFVLFSLLFPFISIIGDLLFSYNKRKHSIKDYSNFIPGHGGVLDRLDSITLCLFVAFIMIYLQVI